MDELFISDLDGTLLNGTGCLSDSSQRILRRLLKEGLCFTVATGRTPLSAWPILKCLPLCLPVIMMNGALIEAPENRQILHSVPIDVPALCLLAEAEKKTGLRGLLLGIKDGRFTATFSQEETPFWKEFFTKNHFSSHALEISKNGAADWQRGELLYGIYTDDTPGRLLRFKELLTHCDELTLDYYKDIYRPDSFCLELFCTRATKGAAAKKLRELTGAKRMTAFGDSGNDLSLFEECEEAYAVSNAREDVKNAAHAVIGHCLEDGVAEYLKRRWHHGTF